MKKTNKIKNSGRIETFLGLKFDRAMEKEKTVKKEEEYQKGHESSAHTAWCTLNVESTGVPSNQCWEDYNVQRW